MKTRLLKKLRAKYCKKYRITEVHGVYRLFHVTEDECYAYRDRCDTFDKICKVLAENVRLDIKSELSKLRETNCKYINPWK